MISISTPSMILRSLPSVTVSSPINAPVWASCTLTFNAESVAFWIWFIPNALSTPSSPTNVRLEESPNTAPCITNVPATALSPVPFVSTNFTRLLLTVVALVFVTSAPIPSWSTNAAVNLLSKSAIVSLPSSVTLAVLPLPAYMLISCVLSRTILPSALVNCAS